MSERVRKEKRGLAQTEHEKYICMPLSLATPKRPASFPLRRSSVRAMGAVSDSVMMTDREESSENDLSGHPPRWEI